MRMDDQRLELRRGSVNGVSDRSVRQRGLIDPLSATSLTTDTTDTPAHCAPAAAACAVPFRPRSCARPTIHLNSTFWLEQVI